MGNGLVSKVQVCWPAVRENLIHCSVELQFYRFITIPWVRELTQKERAQIWLQNTQLAFFIKSNWFPWNVCNTTLKLLFLIPFYFLWPNFAEFNTTVSDGAFLWMVFPSSVCFSCAPLLLPAQKCALSLRIHTMLRIHVPAHCFITPAQFFVYSGYFQCFPPRNLRRNSEGTQ